jgi:dimethylargininase
VLVAITRPVSDSFASCQLTHVSRVPIDVDLARAQHRAYERALADAGCAIVRANDAPDLPDSVFVEDVAIVFDELAVLARPGAPTRRGERDGLAPILERYRTLRRIEAPGTLDGGDVLVAGRCVYVGRSTRTNQAAIDQLSGFLTPHGYQVRATAVTSCLHLKSAATTIGPDRLLVNRRWIDAAEFDGFDLVDVDPHEPAGANIVRVGDSFVYPGAFPRTRDRLETLGIRIVSVDVSEITKAEGGVTCCSLIFDPRS